MEKAIVKKLHMAINEALENVAKEHGFIYKGKGISYSDCEVSGGMKFVMTGKQEEVARNTEKYAPLGCEILIGNEIVLKGKKFTLCSYTKRGSGIIKDSSGKEYRLSAKGMLNYSNKTIKINNQSDKVVRCNDCGKGKDGLHGGSCDIERCPKCGGQLFSCDCNFRNRSGSNQYLTDENNKRYKRNVVKTECDM